MKELLKYYLCRVQVCRELATLQVLHLRTVVGSIYESRVGVETCGKVKLMLLLRTIHEEGVLVLRFCLRTY